MKKKVFFSLLLTLMFCSSTLFSQEKEKNFSMYGSLELNAKYVWRGIPLGDAPTLFPSFGANYKKFNFLAFAGYALNGSYSVVALYATYMGKNFYIGLGDYYVPADNVNNYLNWHPKETSHSYELYATFTPASLPLYLTLSTFIYGNDRYEDTGRNKYSSYVELGYSKQLSENQKLSLGCGFTPFKSFYANKLNIINIALKYESFFALGTYKLPFSGSLIVNPNTENIFLSFSLYIR